MFDIFGKSEKDKSLRVGFPHMGQDVYYFDNACQTPRPQEVIDAEMQYYMDYNACGGRVQYAWGKRVDREVSDTRDAVLRFLHRPPSSHAVAFTQSTTYAINLILSQIQADSVEYIVTTDKEHNSVFLPSISYARQRGWKRHVTPRREDGGVDLRHLPNAPMIFIANMVSNIDGSICANMKEICDHVHAYGGLVIIDAAQAMTQADLMRDIDYDALCFSGHKMYAPSMGVMVYKQSLLAYLDMSFVGGGMVESVRESDYTLVKGDASALLEPGLQNWASIVGLRSALAWLDSKPYSTYAGLRTALWNGLSTLPVTLLGAEGSSVISLYGDAIESHRAAQALSTRGIMVRSGYFCCHYYLKELRDLPPLLRVSIGAHNTEEDIRYLISSLSLLYSS